MSQNFGGRRENDYGGGGQRGGDRWSNEDRNGGYREGPRAQREGGFGGQSRGGFPDREHQKQGNPNVFGGFGGGHDRGDQGKRAVGGFGRESGNRGDFSQQQQSLSPHKDFNGYRQQQRSPQRDEFHEYQQQRPHPRNELNGYQSHQEQRAPPPRRDYPQRPSHQEDRDRGYRDGPRAQGDGGFGGPPRGGFSDRGHQNQGNPNVFGGFGGGQNRGSRDRDDQGRDRGDFGRERGDRGGFARFSEEAGPVKGFSRGEDHRGDRGGFDRDGGDSRRGGFDSGARGGFSSGGGFSRGDSSGFSRGDSSGFSRGFDSKYHGGNYHDQDNDAALKFGQGRTFEPEGGVRTRTFERSWGGESMGARAPRGWMPDDVKVEKLYAIDKLNVEESIYDQDSEVTVDGSEIKDRFETWDHAPLDERLRRTCKEKCGYPRPRNIQSAFIPQVLNGYDVLGQAETGSGKTAAFALPILEKIIEKKHNGDKKDPHAPYALILSPTRELTEQLYQQLIKFASGCDIDIHRSYGQMARYTSVNQINKGCDILVGCIGRIRDLIMKNDVSMDNILFFVLDECDRLLDPKDIGDIMEIAERMPPPGKRQTLMLSATFSPNFDSVARTLINAKKHCTIKASNLNKKITHEFHQASGIFNKNQKMTEILKKEYDEAHSKGQDMPRTLIFVSRKLKAQTTAAEICKFFADIQKDMAASICSDNDQEARNRIINAISEGRSRVLVGTDLCERGLDINNLDVVINYDMPPVADRYTHRTGRTGRNKPGRAYNIVDPEDSDGLRELSEIIQRVKNIEQEVPSWLEELANRRGGGTFGGGMRSGGFHAGGMGGSGSGGFHNERQGFNTGGFKSGGFSSNGGFNNKSSAPNENGSDSSRFSGGGFSSSRGGFASTIAGFSSASKQDDEGWGSDDEMVKKIDEVKIETKPESNSAVELPAQPREESKMEPTIREDDW